MGCDTTAWSFFLQFFFLEFYYTGTEPSNVVQGSCKVAENLYCSWIAAMQKIILLQYCEPHLIVRVRYSNNCCRSVNWSGGTCTEDLYLWNTVQQARVVYNESIGLAVRLLFPRRAYHSRAHSQWVSWMQLNYVQTPLMVNFHNKLYDVLKCCTCNRSKQVNFGLCEASGVWSLLCYDWLIYCTGRAYRYTSGVWRILLERICERRLWLIFSHRAVHYNLEINT